MKVRYIWKLSTTFFLRKWKRNMVQIILIAICFSVLTFAFMYVETTRYARKVADRTLTQGIRNTKCLEFGREELERSETSEFLQELNENPAITAAGSFVYNSVLPKCLGDLNKISGGYLEGGVYSFDGAAVTLTAAKKVIPLCRLEIEKGIQPEELKETEANHFLMYMGSAYKDIPVGTIYQESHYHTTWTYEVAGILKEGQKFLNDDVISLESGNLQSCTSLDELILFVTSDSYIDAKNYIAVKAGMEGEGLKAIVDAAEKYDISYKLTNLEEVFDNLDKSNEKFIKMSVRLAGFMLGLAILLNSSQEMVSFMKRQHEFGILYTQGFMEKEVILLVLLEVLKRTMAELLMVMFGSLVFGVWLSQLGNDRTQAALLDMLVRYIYPKIGMIMLLTGVVSVIIPVIVIHKKTPVKLMEES